MSKVLTFLWSPVVTDVTAPVISAVASSGLSASAATVTWTTNEAADSQVQYGLTTGYGAATTLNASLVTSHSQNVSGLSASTLYHYRVLSRDAASNLSTGTDNTFTTSAAVDVTAPVISSVASGTLTATGATVTWTTNEASDTQIEYGTTVGYGTSTTLNVSMVTSHSQAIAGLSAGTTYHYRVKSRDAAGNLATGTDNTFVTTAADVTAPVISSVASGTLTAAGATVTWTTNEAADSQIEYGTTVGYGTSTTLNASLVTSHSQAITGLSASTLYHYRVKSKDASANLATGSDNTFTTTASGTLNVGSLIQDGPATPEQISLYLAVTGSLTQAATATCRYKVTGAGTWTTGHPLYRIQPSLSVTPDVGTTVDAFAWPIIDLLPGTSYDVEVSVTAGATTDVKTLTTTTRSLPSAAGPPNKTIAAGASNATIQTAFNGLVAGDVIQFANGNYTITGLQWSGIAGTAGNEIYIRGASREGTVLTDTSDSLLQILDAHYIVLEHMTVVGSGTDSSTAASSCFINFYDGNPGQTQITVRDLTATGFDRGIKANAVIHGFLMYDCLLEGNNVWNTTFVDSNITWNDDGIQIPGTGNFVFNVTMDGFGDSLSFAAHVGGTGLTENRGCFFARMEVRNSGDDFCEADYAKRNNAVYDCRVTNSMTFLSLDPLHAGPFLFARNISINTGRTPFKWNTGGSGQFVYNNTVVSTTKRYATVDPPAESGWYQSNNGDQESYGYRNNVLVYRGSGSYTIRLDNTGHTKLDFDHNSWYPNLPFQWPSGSYSNLAAAYSGLASTTPVFSGYIHRHESDTTVVTNPWTTTVTLGANYLTEVTATYLPELASGGTAKNSGVVIPNITDGYTGAAPDRGAKIPGRATVQYGDRTPAPGTVFPFSLAVGQWGAVPRVGNSRMADVYAGDPGDGNGSAFILRAWSGSAFDTLRSDLLIWNGGHRDYSGNEVYAFSCDPSSPYFLTWRRKSYWSARSGTAGSQETFTGGAVSTKHTYYSLVYDPVRDDLVVMPGGFNWGDSPTASSYLWTFDCATETPNTAATAAWTAKKAPVAGFPQSGSPAPLAVYDSAADRFVEYCAKGLSDWNAATNTWTNYTSFDDVSDGYHTGAVYVPGTPAHLLVIGVHSGSTPFAQAKRLDTHATSANSTSQSVWGMTGATAAMANSPGVVYCPNAGKVFVWAGLLSGGTDTRDYYEIDFATKVSAKRTGTGALPPTPMVTGVFSKFQYVGDGLCILLNEGNEDVYFLRVAAPA